MSEPGPDPDPSVTLGDDIQGTESAIASLNQQLDVLEGGSFSRRVKTFLGLSRGQVTDEVFVETVLSDAFLQVLTLRENSAGDPIGLDYAASRGTYTWNSASETWESTSSNSGIVYLGPSSSSSSSNDVQLSVSRYTDEFVRIDGDPAYLPTEAEASIDVDGQNELQVQLSNVIYDTNGETPIPVEFDLTLFTNPFEHRLTVRRNTSTDFDLTFEMIDADGTIVTGVDATLELASTDYNTLDDGDFERATLTINLGSGLSVEGEADIGRLLTLQNPTAQEINDEITNRVVFMGRELGTLRYDETREDMVIEYRDGSTDLTGRYYDPFLDALESTLQDYAGDVELNNF
jgi:hypothetical protein